MEPSSNTKSKRESDDEFDWIKIKAKVDGSQVAPVGMNRLMGLVISNPFVPIGCISTVAALGLGLKNFYGGHHSKQQMMMRARVGAQGFTIAALIGGIFYQAYKDAL